MSIPFFKGVGLTFTCLKKGFKNVLMMRKKGDIDMDVFAGKIETGKNGFTDFDSIFGAVREFNEETIYSVYLFLSGKTMDDYEGRLGSLMLVADSQEFFESKIRKNIQIVRNLPSDIKGYNPNYKVHSNLLVAFGIYILEDVEVPLNIFSGTLDNESEYEVFWIPIKELYSTPLHPRLKMVNFQRKMQNFK